MQTYLSLCVSYGFIISVLQLEGRRRISADEAMKHSYFQELGERIHKLPDSKDSPPHI